MHLSKYFLGNVLRMGLGIMDWEFGLERCKCSAEVAVTKNWL
jgi:hypothetical protein